MLGKTIIVSKMIKSIYAGMEGVIVAIVGDNNYEIYFPSLNMHGKLKGGCFSIKEHIITSSWVFYNGSPLVRIEHNRYLTTDDIRTWYAEHYDFNYDKLSVVCEPSCVKCPV